MNSTYSHTDTEDWLMAELRAGSQDGATPVYHKPVLLRECIEQLALRPDATVVDATFGGGGHAALILQHLSHEQGGRLIAFDQDPDAKRNAQDWGYPHFTFVPANFRHLARYLQVYKTGQVDGLLADLGISSFQIDEPRKGFSIRFDGPLDMRMAPSQPLSAREVVNEYPAVELTRVLREYGEVDKPRFLADRIILARTRRPIETTTDLKEAIMPLAPRKREFKFLAQVFQAIRIEVNDELGALKALLEQARQVIRPGGRLVVLTYHSLEDRLVKNYLAKGKFDGEVDKDLYGHEIRPFAPVWRKAIVPTEDELFDNPRARSAKLRVAERLPDRDVTPFGG